MFTCRLHTANDVIHSTKASMWAAQQKSKTAELELAIIATIIFVTSYAGGSHHNSGEMHLWNNARSWIKWCRLRLIILYAAANSCSRAAPLRSKDAGGDAERERGETQRIEWKKRDRKGEKGCGCHKPLSHQRLVSRVSYKLPLSHSHTYYSLCNLTAGKNSPSQQGNLLDKVTAGLREEHVGGSHMELMFSTRCFLH